MKLSFYHKIWQGSLSEYVVIQRTTTRNTLKHANAILLMQDGSGFRFIWTQSGYAIRINWDSAAK